MSNGVFLFALDPPFFFPTFFFFLLFSFSLSLFSLAGEEGGSLNSTSSFCRLIYIPPSVFIKTPHAPSCTSFEIFPCLSLLFIPPVAGRRFARLALPSRHGCVDYCGAVHPCTFLALLCLQSTHWCLVGICLECSISKCHGCAMPSS